MPRLSVSRSALVVLLSVFALLIAPIGSAHANTALQAELSADQVVHGDSITVSGTVTGADGPIGDAAVEVYGGTDELNLASFETDADGTFSGDVTIPETAGAGGDFPEYPIVISVPPTPSMAAVEQALTVTLTDPPAADTPEEPAVEPVPEQEPADEQPAEAQTQPDTSLNPFDLVPWWMAVIGVLGLAALAGLAFLARRRRPDENARLFH